CPDLRPGGAEASGRRLGQAAGHGGPDAPSARRLRPQANALPRQVRRMTPALDIKDPATFQGPDAPEDDDLATCVHCGLCLNYCPTFRVTGLETESPRGRIYLMTQWKRGGLPFTEDLAEHIDLCLG